MNRFRKVHAEEGSGYTEDSSNSSSAPGSTQSAWDKMRTEMDITNYPFEFRSELFRTYGPNADPTKVEQLYNDLIAKIENYDKTNQSFKRFYEDNMPGTYESYLDGMLQKYNVHYWVAAKFFMDAWNIYSSKFSSVKGFSKLFDQLKETYGPNIPMALTQLKTLIDKLPSAFGRVENEENFIDILVQLSKNPDDEGINKLFEQFMINEFIRDLILGKTDEKIMAANVVNTTNLVKEIGRTELTDTQKLINKNYYAYNLYVTKTMGRNYKNFDIILQQKEKLYKDLTTDIVANGLDSEKMRIIFESLYNAIRLRSRTSGFLNPSEPSPQTPPDKVEKK